MGVSPGRGLSEGIGVGDGAGISHVFFGGNGAPQVFPKGVQPYYS